MKLRSYRKDLDYSYAIGVYPTLELLTHQPQAVLRVLVSASGEANEGVAQIRCICHDVGIPLIEADAQVERLAGAANAYAVGVFAKYEHPLHADANHLVLVHPSDAGNLGTIARTMLAFGLADLGIVTPATDLFSPKTIRASMGAVFQLRFDHPTSFGDYQGQFDRSCYPFMTDGREALAEVTFRPPYALVFGNESAGLDPTYHTVGTSVRIPQSERVDSLNLAVSVGIGLYAAATHASDRLPTHRPQQTC